jgi:hypothetical protein
VPVGTTMLKRGLVPARASDVSVFRESIVEEKLGYLLAEREFQPKSFISYK